MPRSGGACAIGDCTCIVPTLSDPRATSGPRIDRIPAGAAAMERRRSSPRIKKYFFRPPVRVPPMLFGPVANGTDTAKRLHVAFDLLLASVLHAASSKVQKLAWPVASRARISEALYRCGLSLPRGPRVKAASYRAVPPGSCTKERAAPSLHAAGACINRHRRAAAAHQQNT